jgi:hypothetical protein
MMDVSAIVVGAVGTPALPAVADVVRAHSPADLCDAAMGARCELVWLVDATAKPNERTLASLLSAHESPVVSLPVDRDGSPLERLLGRFIEDDPPALVEAATRRRVPLRHTAIVSLLMTRDTLLAHSPPDPARFGWYAGSEWTARVFARDGGELVPESVVTAADAPFPPSVAEVVRMSRSGVWARGEMLRELHRCVDKAGMLSRFTAARGFD